MKKNLVSIIIPVFNKEKFILNCINSVIRQSYENIEIIVIDDGSTDDSKKIIESIKDDRLKLFSIKNGGVSNARNYGMKKATGEFILFIDADDYIEEKAVEKLYYYITNYKIDIVRYNGYIQNKYGNFTKIDFPVENGLILSSESDQSKILDLIINPSCSVRCYSPLLFFKNKDIKKFKRDVKYLEDKIFYLDNFLNKKKILFIDECLYYYVYDGRSITNNSEKSLESLKEILKSKKYVFEIIEDKANKKVRLVEELYGTLLLYKVCDFINNFKTYKSAKKFMNDLFVYEIMDEIRKIDKKKLSKFKLIQFLLLEKKFFLLEYYIIKIKNFLKR